MLNYLEVQGNENYEKTHNVVPVKFQTHHISEMLMHFLGRIDLDRSTKLVIYLKEKPQKEQVYNCDNYFRVSWYYVSSEDIKKVKACKGIERDVCYLNIITGVLKEIAQKNQCEERILERINEAAAEVINQKFNLAFQVKKLSKASKDRQYRMRIYRNLCPEGEKWSAEIKEKAKPAKTVDLMKNYAHISKAGVFFKAEWKENTYFLYDRLGNVMAAITPAEKILQLFSVEGLRETIEIGEYRSEKRKETR